MLDRRQFLQSAATTGAGLATAGFSLAPGSVLGANDKVIVAVMGVNSRGRDHCNSLMAQPNAEIAYICDVDERALARAIDMVEKKTGKKPKGVSDIRKVLEDPAVDALTIAAPDHWHAPATIMACAAGKHVYVEKPASHNAREGELAIAAARKHNRVVQLGTQRRSMPAVREAIEKVHSGAIGKVVFARGWYNNNRKGIGNGKPAPVPQWLDYSLWQGPAPERPFQDNLIHYNWHWFWNWGTGELGNNGIHSLDVCRWGLGVDYPERITAGGGKYGFVEDDQETPDIMITTYHFGPSMITWEGRSRQAHGIDGSGFGVAFYGDKGSIIIDGANYRVFDPAGKELGKFTGSSSDHPHFANFLECIRSSQRPNADIEEGVKSTMLCHLGNIAWRTGNTVNADPKTGHVKEKAAQAFWGREYRKGWEPHV